MNIYIVSQSVNNNYDTYDAMVVIAETDKSAKELTVSETAEMYDAWAGYEHLKCEFIGTALENSEEKIVLQSYNAG